MIACIVDLETTGVEPSDQIVEIGSYLISQGGLPKSPFHCLVAPTIAIPPTASAVHHITDEDLIQASTWAQVGPAWYAKTAMAEVFVAQNAKFEMMHLAEMTAPRPWVCTFKCAMRAWPDAPGFSNQVLRYWRAPAGLDRLMARESHRALPDAYVTAFLFRDLLAEHSLETLIGWTLDPAMPPRLTFGKHKGMAWAEAPDDYLEWIVWKSDMDEDTKGCARFHLDARRPPPAEETAVQVDPRATRYLELARPTIAMIETIEDLTRWWKDEREHRFDYGIFDGTAVYADLVALCTDRKAQFPRSV